jgi:hypothetical protein
MCVPPEDRRECTSKTPHINEEQESLGSRRPACGTKWLDAFLNRATDREPAIAVDLTYEVRGNDSDCLAEEE